MTEEWPATTKHQSDNHEDPHHGGESSLPSISGDPNQLDAQHAALSRYPLAGLHQQYAPPDYTGANPGLVSLVPPPPIAPDAAAAAAAAAVAAYPPMHSYQTPPWQPYGPPPPMPYGGMYPPFANPYGPPHPTYQQGPPHMHPPYHHYDPSLATPGHYEPPPGIPLPGFPPEDTKTEEEEDEDDLQEDELGTYGAAARMKMYVKSKVPTRQEILDRRARKNAQSRARAAKLRERIGEIKERVDDDRTDEEKAMMDQYENRRSRKNDRSRERAIEKKTEIDRILNKPERKRTKLEKQFLETALTAKQRKNEGDRLRRQRIKMSGKPSPGMEVRGGPAFRPDSIPMSPLPSHQFGPAFPGAPAYPSPRHASASGILETPVGGAPATGVPLPFIPPSQFSDPQPSPQGRSQLHLPQHSSQVEQRRHPDGSMSISIGGSRASDEMGDMAQILLYGENGEGDGVTDQDDETEV